MRALIVLFYIGLVSLSWGQTNLELKIIHLWKNSFFNYGNSYTDLNDNAVELDRVQYYLSNFTIYHDGGQVKTLDSVFVLASGNISHYPLNSVTGVSTIDSLDFDLGIDSNWNHLDPSLYDASHPLAPQVPNMHWGWTGGYNFLVLEGDVDSDGNGSLDAFFEFHCVGDDSFLRHVGPIVPNLIYNGNDVTMEIQANVSDWLVGVDLTTALANHGAMPVNEQIMDNTLLHTVFGYSGKAASLDENDIKKNVVHFDYSMSYAPSIFYKFPSSQTVDLKIVDMAGSKLMEKSDLVNEGNFFINKELKTGFYFAVFKTSDGHIISEKFVVRN